MQNQFDDTICAPATGSGGAIAVIRVSGPQAIALTDCLFSGGKPLADAAGYSLHFGTIRDGEGVLVDEVLVSLFRAPHSYTGEDAVEISCHASDYIVSRILALLVSGGARMAEPGEFTKRAFLNGKMDLAQAEAVADLIASQTAASHRIAINQLKGGFSDELAAMRTEMLQLASLLELELDFSEEDVAFADRQRLSELVEAVLGQIRRLIGSFRLGNAIKNGVPVAIVGNTNSGKSTLLNTLLGEDRAIVSSIPGTTRDTVEETLTLDGVLFRFIDTAGLRESNDEIERIGIGRSYEKLSSADLILAVLDLSAPQESIRVSIEDIVSRCNSNQRVIFLLNKVDVVSSSTIASIRVILSPYLTEDRGAFVLSAKQRLGIDDLLLAITEKYRSLQTGAETTLVSNVRHLEALQNAESALSRVREGLGNPDDPASALPSDLLAQDLREALWHLASIVGEVTTDEILGNIFQKFCIGK